MLTWNKNETCSEEMVAEGFQVHRLYGLNLNLVGVVQDYPYLPSMPAKLEKLRPDIVHGESHLFLPTVQAIRKAKKMGLPCVVTVHGVFADRDIAFNFFQNLYLRTLGLDVFRKADRIICLTRSDAKEVASFGCHSEKIRLIPNAVDIELFKPEDEREDNLIVWVGRFVPEKGIRYLIEAAATVVNKFKDAKFLLIGYGPLKAKLMKMAYDRGLLGGSVHFLGTLSRNEIANTLRRATVFVIPSLKEGMPISLLEAMASGLAVVGSDIPGINDPVIDEENGLLVSPKNPEILANAILSLLGDSRLRTKLSQNARKHIVENHRWEIIIKRIEKIYNEALEVAL
ncbi:hypothetical protein AC478_02865 [miscellaneous Crenarchaeota group-1 archaeon SG8-32-3]|uniref:Glycosyltransferase family 1 protein n=1 Tax=miscellaneous Crenarchaeota group-1 archaeon SG8-32-3 TaxID=1685125 RepID=A0A0M0BSI6_9ARCH|nr:MAG: hypothetical protein AC478_02865 [miscellaneous Crenarchaeota group-1 archaeon SG8-32-3]